MVISMDKISIGIYAKRAPGAKNCHARRLDKGFHLEDGILYMVYIPVYSCGPAKS